jgi:MFS family permease
VSEAGAQAAAAHERGVGRPAQRLLLLVGPVLLIETMFFTAVAPLLPHYEETLGLSKFQAGVLVGAYGAGCFAGAIPGGIFASRVGVKPTMVVGLTLLAALSVVFAFATSTWLLDGARFGQGVGAALAWTGALSWLVMEGSRERRGELIGIATAAAAAGALLGPALGGVASVVGTRPTFAAAALPALILAIACLLVTAPTARVAQHPRSLIGAVGRPRLATGLWLMTLASLALGALDVLAPLRLGHFGMSGAAIGAIFLAAAATQTGANVFVGRHADRHGRSATLRLVLVAAVAVALGLMVANRDWLLALLVVCAGTVFGAFFAPSMALVTDEAELAGIELVLVLALLNIAWSPGQLIGTAGSGALASATGDWVPYLVVAVLCFGSLALLGRLTRTRNSPAGVLGNHR